MTAFRGGTANQMAPGSGILLYVVSNVVYLKYMDNICKNGFTGLLEIF